MSLATTCEAPPETRAGGNETGALVAITGPRICPRMLSRLWFRWLELSRA